MCCWCQDVVTARKEVLYFIRCSDSNFFTYDYSKEIAAHFLTFLSIIHANQFSSKQTIAACVTSRFSNQASVSSTSTRASVSIKASGDFCLIDDDPKPDRTLRQPSCYR